MEDFEKVKELMRKKGNIQRLEDGKWVSTKERLPELGERVWNYGAWGYDCGERWDDYWELAGGDNLANYSEVEYWMPIQKVPEPPKGEDNGS